MSCVSMACGNSEIKDMKEEMDHAEQQSRLIELVDEQLQDQDRAVDSILGTGLLPGGDQSTGRRVWQSGYHRRIVRLYTHGYG